jgi:putative ABC transport system permease protein
MGGWLRDLRYAARALRSNPAFTAAAFVTMTIAIGATTAVFSVFDAVLLRPLPIASADQIVAIGVTARDAPAVMRSASLEEIDDWRSQSKTMTAVGAWRDWGLIRYDGAERERVFGIVATPALFEVFPVRPVLGRLLTDDDERPGAGTVALLGHAYWRQRFGSDAAVVGRTMVLERGARATFTIVGVLPPDFTDIPSFARVQVVLPSAIDPDARHGRALRNRLVYARLAAGATAADARAEMDVVAARLADRYPATNAERSIRVETAIEYEAGTMGQTLRAFFASVGLVLLIAAANVAGLQLARALARRREFAIRRAVGGSRIALMRALVSETAILSILAGVAGLVLSRWLVDLALTLGPAIPRAAAVPVDARLIGFTAAVCAASSLLLAVPAALLSTRIEPAQALKEQATQAGGGALRARTLFVGAQAALALMIFAGAGAATGALMRTLAMQPGFDPEGLGWISLTPPMSRYPKGADIAALYDRLVREARAVPGVVGASAVSATPLSGAGAEPSEFTIDGQPAPGPARPSANTFNVAPGYFKTLGVALTRGRDFGAADVRGAEQVAIVNAAFVRRFLGTADPLAVTLHVGSDPEPVHIVGVAGDLLQIVGPRAAAQPEIYVPYTQRPRWATYLVVRAAGPSPRAFDAIRARIAAVDPEITAGVTVSMTARLQRSARGPKFVTLVSATFAGIALLLCITGIAGLVLYTTAQRRREIAVRVSLGATRRDIVRVVGGAAFRALIFGSLVGLAGSLVVSRAVGAILPDVDPMGPLGAAGSALVFVAAGALACYVPARRAAGADPVEVMRS